MTDLFDTMAHTERAAADLLLPLFRAGDRITRSDLNAAMTAAFGGSDAAGRWTQRDSFEVLELATTLYTDTDPGKVLSLAMLDAYRKLALDAQRTIARPQTAQPEAPGPEARK